MIIFSFHLGSNGSQGDVVFSDDMPTSLLQGKGAHARVVHISLTDIVELVLNGLGDFIRTKKYFCERGYIFDQIVDFLGPFICDFVASEIDPFNGLMLNDIFKNFHGPRIPYPTFP